jgi:hypothetical protein
MPQSLAQIWLRIAFGTQGRRAYQQHPKVREELFRTLRKVRYERYCRAGCGGTRAQLTSRRSSDDRR